MVHYEIYLLLPHLQIYARTHCSFNIGESCFESNVKVALAQGVF